MLDYSEQNSLEIKFSLSVKITTVTFWKHVVVIGRSSFKVRIEQSLMVINWKMVCVTAKKGVFSSVNSLQYFFFNRGYRPYGGYHGGYSGHSYGGYGGYGGGYGFGGGYRFSGGYYRWLWGN